MLRQQLLRFLIGGFQALGGFNRRRNAHDLRILLLRALVSRRCPSHMAASGGVADESDIFAATTHARRQLIHQVRAKGEVVERLDVHVRVHLVARLMRHHFYSRRPGLLQDLLERLRRIRNHRDRVGLLPDQLPNDVGLLLRISIVRADHGGVNPVLRGKLFDPLLHALEPRDPGSLDDRDDPDFLRLRITSVALAA